MPIIQTCPGTNDLCYTCDEPGNPLRTCSKCKIARYCSSQCQKAHWKVHKETCMDHKANLQASDIPGIETELKVFLKWNDTWRDGLVCWGLFSADLANQSPNYLLTHSFFVRIERRLADNKRAKYQAVWSEYREQNVGAFRALTPGRNVLRYTVENTAVGWPCIYSVAGNNVQAVVGEKGANDLMNSQSAESRVLSMGLKEAWKTKFGDHLRAGDTTGHLKVFLDFNLVANAMSGVALDVD
ncbi:hypothetical protein C8R43DRAFT_707609 [Mycena crocata]|nr:hypothetical protein C8R43DRAFT_707609 [Mycena crocata]